SRPIRSRPRITAKDRSSPKPETAGDDSKAARPRQPRNSRARGWIDGRLPSRAVRAAREQTPKEGGLKPRKESREGSTRRGVAGKGEEVRVDDTSTGSIDRRCSAHRHDSPRPRRTLLDPRVPWPTTRLTLERKHCETQTFQSLQSLVWLENLGFERSTQKDSMLKSFDDRISHRMQIPNSSFDSTDEEA